MFSPVDIKEKLLKVRDNDLKKVEVLTWVDEVFKKLDKERTLIQKRLQSGSESNFNVFQKELLDVDNIFHISHIKEICISYRLRFLDSSLFKGDYPEEAISKIREIERKHNISLKGFKIIAPLRLFKVKKADDPMLFVPIDDQFYYLIHKWGNDLHPLRKMTYWGIKKIQNLGILLGGVSVLLAFITYPIFFKNQQNVMYGVILAMFYFKGFIGWMLLFGISSGKNFSEYSWKSKYDKVS